MLLVHICCQILKKLTENIYIKKLGFLYIFTSIKCFFHFTLDIIHKNKKKF